MKKTGIRLAASLCTLALAGAGSGCAGMSANLSPQAAGAHMTLLAMNMASDQAEIAEGQMALTSAAAPAVREFAQEMVTEHTASMQRQQQTLAGMGLTPEMLMAMPVFQAMTQNHRQAMQAMQGARGAAFDRAYMDRQAAMHRYLLDQMDAVMRNASGDAEMAGGTTMAMRVPAGVDPGAVMTLEQQARALIAEHEQHAQQVRTSMGSGM
jgi:putative membrane protein